MRIGVAATPDVAIPTLDWLISSEHQVVLVITQPDKPAGRGRAMKQSVVGEWASARGIPVVKPISPEELIGSIDDLDCDYWLWSFVATVHFRSAKTRLHKSPLLAASCI